jgi:para-aminobenzoate synthetase component 2
MSAPKILVVDNFDSFVFNISRYLDELGAVTTVVRSNELDPQQAKNFDGVLISPGPGTPADARISLDVLALCEEESISVLGVCLGHQIIAQHFGARVSSAPELLHGMTSTISHNETGLFSEIPSPFNATRYHSLAVEESSIPQSLNIDARTESGVIMGVSHIDKPIYGVQFHPESVLTEHGHQLFKNWLNLIY